MKKFCYLFTLLAFVLLTSCGDKDWSEVAGPRAIEKALTHGQSAIFTFETIDNWGAPDSTTIDFGDKAAVKYQNKFLEFYLIWTNNTSKAIHIQLPTLEETTLPSGVPFPKKFENFMGIYDSNGNYLYSLIDSRDRIETTADSFTKESYCIPAHTTCKVMVSKPEYKFLPYPWPWIPGTYQVKMKYDFPVTIYDKDYAVVENERGEQEFEQGAVVEEKTTISVDYDMTLVCLE